MLINLPLISVSFRSDSCRTTPLCHTGSLSPEIFLISDLLIRKISYLQGSVYILPLLNPVQNFCILAANQCNYYGSRGLRIRALKKDMNHHCDWTVHNCCKGVPEFSASHFSPLLVAVKYSFLFCRKQVRVAP